MSWLKKRANSSQHIFPIQQYDTFGPLDRSASDVAFDSIFWSKKNHQHTQDELLSLVPSVGTGRMRLGLLFIGLIVLCYFARLVYLQGYQGDYYSALSYQNRDYSETTVPPRGLIQDRDGTPLAWNEPTFVLTMTISELPQNEERIELFARVANLIGYQPTDLDLLVSRYYSRQYDAIPVVSELSYESAIRLAIAVRDLPGFALSTQMKRIYASSVPSLSHVLGYTGLLNETDFARYQDQGYRLTDIIGKTGIEQSYESFLRGVPGELQYEVNAQGEKISILSKKDFLLGSHLTLSIDLEFQKFIETQLRSLFEQTSASRGSVIALNPKTGEVYALVSLPTFESNEFIQGMSQDRYSSLLADTDQPLFSRAIAGEFPSGSTLKPVVAYAAMAEGIVGEHTSFLSSGGLRIGQWFFPDWKAGGHGTTDARKAIAESVNTYFYIVGGGFDETTGLGVERLTEYARRFGFGSPTGIDLPSEGDGFLPSKEWKQEVKGERWYVGDTYHLAIGQGDFLTTPLQLAVATSVIANQGLKVTPYVVQDVEGYRSENLVHPEPTPIVGLDPYALTVVRQGMRQTVTSGSARSLSTLSQAVAGKTGTAQTPGDKPYHSWFTGFGPYEDPTITLVVLVEEGGESTDAAVPLAKQILDWWFRYGDDTD
jgi:penicillin-binding protein 2